MPKFRKSWVKLSAFADFILFSFRSRDIIKYYRAYTVYYIGKFAIGDEADICKHMQLLYQNSTD